MFLLLGPVVFIVERVLLLALPDDGLDVFVQGPFLLVDERFTIDTRTKLFVLDQRARVRAVVTAHGYGQVLHIGRKLAVNGEVPIGTELTGSLT